MINFYLGFFLGGGEWIEITAIKQGQIGGQTRSKEGMKKRKGLSGAGRIVD